MKRKDALWVMQMCRDRDARSEAEREAFDTAIEALSEETSTIQEKHQLSEETSTNTPTKSTNISTNTPIEALKLTFENDTEIKSCSKDSDLISRTEAIEHFMRLSEDESLTPYTQMLMVGASNEIKKLPSADRPRGEWIDRKEEVDGFLFIGRRCSNCDWWENGGYNLPYCPNCGADMRGEDEWQQHGN